MMLLLSALTRLDGGAAEARQPEQEEQEEAALRLHHPRAEDRVRRGELTGGTADSSRRRPRTVRAQGLRCVAHSRSALHHKSRVFGLLSQFNRPRARVPSSP